MSYALSEEQQRFSFVLEAYNHGQSSTSPPSATEPSVLVKSPSSEDANDPPRRRTRPVTACEACRKQRVRCTLLEDQPACQRCAAKGYDCLFRVMDLRKDIRMERFAATASIIEDHAKNRRSSTTDSAKPIKPIKREAISLTQRTRANSIHGATSVSPGAVTSSRKWLSNAETNILARPSSASLPPCSSSPTMPSTTTGNTYFKVPEQRTTIRSSKDGAMQVALKHTQQHGSMASALRDMTNRKGITANVYEKARLARPMAPPLPPHNEPPLTKLVRSQTWSNLIDPATPPLASDASDVMKAAEAWTAAFALPVELDSIGDLRNYDQDGTAVPDFALPVNEISVKVEAVDPMLPIHTLDDQQFHHLMSYFSLSSLSLT